MFHRLCATPLLATLVAATLFGVLCNPDSVFSARRASPFRNQWISVCLCTDDRDQGVTRRLLDHSKTEPIPVQSASISSIPVSTADSEYNFRIILRIFHDIW